MLFFFFQAEDGIRDVAVTGVQTCALPIYEWYRHGQEVGEWAFGLTRADRSPKAALEAVREAFAQVPFWPELPWPRVSDRKSTRLNSSHGYISYAVFCLKKKKQR